MSETLIIDEEDRYARFRLISWWRQERLAASKVLVVGAGALGNEVLKNLALLGVGHIYLIDYDEVEDSNLTRSILYRQSDKGRSKVEVAAERIQQINPDVKVHPVCGNVLLDVGLGVFQEMDLVFGCLDNREARLWTNRSCWKVGTPWVDAGIQEISGVVKVFIPPESACYECGMTETDYKLINLKYSCPLLKREDIQAGKVPTAPTISSIAAGLQVQEGLKILHGHDTKAGVAYVFSGETNLFYDTKYSVREDCLSHDFYPEEIPELELGGTNTVAELFQAAGVEAGDEATLHLDRDIVVRVFDPEGDYERVINRPLKALTQQDAVHPETEEVLQIEAHNLIPAGGDFDSSTLEEIGVPAYDIVKIQHGETWKFFALTGDREKALGPLATPKA